MSVTSGSSGHEMLTYLLLAGNNGAPIDDDLIRRFDVDDPPEAPFHPDERIVWRNHDGSVVFFGWQAFTEVAGIGSHWATDDRGLTAFAGLCWPKDTGWNHASGESWASRLRAFLGQDPRIPDVREGLFGQFTIVSIPERGIGWVLPDWAGIQQWFFSYPDGCTAFSNRAGLCARAAVPPGAVPQRSLTAAGWLIAEGWTVDEETGYWDVERPRAGSYAVIEPGTTARIVEPTSSPLFAPPEDPAPAYEEILAVVEMELRATLRAIAALPLDDRMMALSGGKDSRTLTALILSEGLQDRFRFETHGSPERADAIVAAEIARRFDLEWSLTDASERSADDEMENARTHTWLQEGSTSAWSTFNRTAFAPTAVLTGVGGEGMRWEEGAASGLGVTSTDEILGLIHRTSMLDRLGVLRPEPLAYYRQWVDDWVRNQVELGIPLISIPTLFKQEPWMHARNGPAITSSPRLVIAPFMAPAVLRANHRLAVDRRPDFRFHMDLQRHGSIELSKMSLADAVWPEVAYRHLPDADDYRAIPPQHSSNPDGRTWRQRRYSEYRPLIERAVLDRGNPIHALIDYDRLVDRLATGDVHAGRTRLIWGVLTAALWMGGHDSPVKFE